MFELRFHLKLIKLVFLLHVDVLLKRKEKMGEKKLLIHPILINFSNFETNTVPVPRFLSGGVF